MKGVREGMGGNCTGEVGDLDAGFSLSGATAGVYLSTAVMCMISQSLQGLVSFNSKGIREANKLQVYQYRYQGKLIISMYNSVNEILSICILGID